MVSDLRGLQRKKGGFGAGKPFRPAPGHQAHPVVLNPSDVAFPTARFVRRYRSEDERIEIVCSPSLDEDLSESPRHFRLQLIWINRTKCSDVLLAGATRDL